ncbi:MAG: protein kinase [Planctomycetota bacterium]|jgi:tetratricopeptide (TPR) repeat protein|nr:protein kinase [Planctomycetota bacterium]
MNEAATALALPAVPNQGFPEPRSAPPPISLTSDCMLGALASPLNQTLDKADGDFLAGLLDAGSDDPSLRDYGDRYRYLDVLGEGGQGRVLRFHDATLDRDVAIKVLKPPHTDDRERLLENEGRLGGMLEHPNILPTYDLCRDETGSPFLVMKKVEGVSLDELLKKAHAEGSGVGSGGDWGELSLRRLLNIFLQVCHAIGYAHSRGVLHLDLKPQNVKIGPFGEVYVLDWGFASRIKDMPKLVAGTPLFIAPERFRPGQPDERCDVYSLGVMLYRILVNQLPRDVGRTSFKDFRRRFHEFPIIPPRRRNPSLPRDLEAIVMKALCENPEDRYRNVAGLAGDLERFLDILPVAAYREGWFGRSLKFARRHRAAVFAGAVMLAAAAFTVMASIRARRLAAEAAEVQARVEDEQRRRELTNLELIKAEEARRLQMEARQREEEAVRRELLRRRAAARVPLEKGMDIMDKSRSAVDKERNKAKKLQLLQPAIDFFSQALAILEAGGSSSRDAAEAYYARARAFERAQEISRAASDYRAAYGLDESYIMARYYLGLIYFNNMDRDVKNALAEFTAMNAIDPGNEFSEIGLAYIEAHTGREAEALARVDRLEIGERAARGEAGRPEESWQNPGLYNIWLIRGRIHGNREGKFYDPEKAIEAYSNFSRYDPDKPAPYINRGILHLALRDQALRRNDAAEAERRLDLAIGDFDLALAADPGSKLALEHRGFALFKFKNRLAEGQRDIEAAIAIDPTYVSAIFDLAAIHETLEQYDLAEQDYARIRDINPDHPNLDYRLGILRFYANRLPEADACLAVAVQKAPDAASRAVRLHRHGIIRFLRGDFQGAIDAFSQSLALRRDGRIYPALMRWLAEFRLGRTPDAAGLAQNIDAGPDKPWLDMVAGIYLGDDPLGEDRAMLLADSPVAACETGFYLGARAWARGETVNALAFLKRAIDSDVRLFMEYSMAKILHERLARDKEEADRLPDRVGSPLRKAPAIPASAAGSP